MWRKFMRTSRKSISLYTWSSPSKLPRQYHKIHGRLWPTIRFQGWRRKEETQVFFRRVRPSRWLRARILILLLRDSNGGWWRCQLAENAWESQLDMPRLAGRCSHSRRAFCAPSFYPSSHSSSLSSPCCPLFLPPYLSLSSSPSFLSLGSLPFFLFLRSPLVSFQFSFVRYARSVHLLYDGRTCILRGPPQKEVALKGKARLIR